MKNYVLLALGLIIGLWPAPAPAEEDEAATVFTQGEIIVTGQRSPAELINSIQEINEEDIKASGADNVAEVLQFAAGTRVDIAPTSLSANGKAEFLASLRGFDPRNVAVFVDGIPVCEPYFRVLDLRQIPVGDIAKIQIIKGPSSVLYGPNTLGGVINIITKKGAGPARGHIDGSYGNVETIKGNASVLGGPENFEYFFLSGFEKSDGFPVSDDFRKTRNEDGGLRNNSDSRDVVLSGKFGYDKSLNGLTLSANYYEFDGGVPFSMEAIQPGTLWRKLWRKAAVALHGELNPADFLYARAKLFYTRFYNTITTYEDASMSSVLDGGKAVSTYDNDIFGYILLPEFILGPWGTITLMNIYKQDRVRIQDERGGPWYDHGAETISGGAEYGVAFWKMALTAGAAESGYRRTETPGTDLGRDNNAFDYQAGLAFIPWPLLELRTAAAHKSSFPDLKTLYGSEGNPNLKPEFADNIDAGVRLNPLPEVSLESTYFYSRIKDLIGKKEMGNDFTFENIDAAWIQGVENTWRAMFFDKLIGFTANYTYMKTRDLREERKLKSLDFRPEHTASVDGRLNLPFGTHLAVQYLFVGERKYEVPGQEREIRTLPEYGLTNARIGHTITWDNQHTSAEFFISGKNIFDVYYEPSPEKPAPGRMVDAGVAVDF